MKLSVIGTKNSHVIMSNIVNLSTKIVQRILESQIINLARKFLNPPDLAEFLQIFKIKAKPQ